MLVYQSKMVEYRGTNPPPTACKLTFPINAATIVPNNRPSKIEIERINPSKKRYIMMINNNTPNANAKFSRLPKSLLPTPPAMSLIAAGTSVTQLQ